jgi:hypothetical protein
MLNHRTLVLTLWLLAGAATAVLAARESGPTILDVQLYVMDGMLAGTIRSDGLLSERIAGTVQSGLPAVVELFYNLETPDNKSIKRGLQSFELRYDVWDDLYSITGGDTVVFHSSFESLSRAVQHLRKIRLFPMHDLSPEREYAVRFGISVNPLQGTDRRKISGWLDSNVRGSSDESWREQVLNLNDLIQHFFSRRKAGAQQSEWYRTKMFKPGSLPNLDDEEP